MVFAWPLAGAHTWAQSIGGLLLGVVFLGGLLRPWPRPGDSTNRL